MQFAEPSVLAVGHLVPALAEGDLDVGDAALLGAGRQAGPVYAEGAQHSRCVTLWLRLEAHRPVEVKMSGCLDQEENRLGSSSVALGARGSPSSG